MEEFSKRFNDLFKTKEIPIKDLAKELGLKSTAFFYDWINGKNLPLLDKAINIADYFKVSLDYLFGRSDDFTEKNFNKVPPFDVRFKEILEKFNKSQYRMIKDGICSYTNVYKWFKLKSVPKMESLIKIADYLGISLDYLVGRE